MQGRNVPNHVAQSLEGHSFGSLLRREELGLALGAACSIGELLSTMAEHGALAVPVLRSTASPSGLHASVPAEELAGIVDLELVLAAFLRSASSRHNATIVRPLHVLTPRIRPRCSSLRARVRRRGVRRHAPPAAFKLR